MGDKDNILIDIPRPGGGTNVNGVSFEQPKSQAYFKQALSRLNRSDRKYPPLQAMYDLPPSRVFHINKRSVLNMSDEYICFQNGMNGLCGRECELYCNGCKHTISVSEFDVDVGNGLVAECYKINNDFFEWNFRVPYVTEVRVIAYHYDVKVSVDGDYSFSAIEKIVKKAKEVHEVLKRENIGD